VDITPELIGRAQAGQRAALEDLVTRSYPLVRRWALVQLGNEADADDLTQDVMVRMLQRLGSFRARSSFPTWLYRVTRNAAVDRQRARNRRERGRERYGAELPEARSDGPTPVSGLQRGLERRVRLRAVYRYFLELPVRQRTILDLADLQGYSSPEIAEMLGIEAVTVRTHLFKARRTLRRRILAEDFGAAGESAADSERLTDAARPGAGKERP